MDNKNTPEIKNDEMKNNDMHNNMYYPPNMYMPNGYVPNGVSKTVLILSIIISLLVGAIGGYFVGNTQYNKKLEKAEIYSSSSNQSSNDNKGNDASNNQVVTENEVTVDYSQFKIGNSGFTIDNYYSDEESKMYASRIIGKEIPNIKWKDSAGVEHNTDEIEGEYIIEFFMTTCGYCNNAIPEVDAFREAHPDMKVISLAFDTGDLSAFNAAGENAFYIQNLNTSAEVSEYTNNIPFVPAVIYVKDGVAQLLTFGGPTQSSMEDAMTVAFGE